LLFLSFCKVSKLLERIEVAQDPHLIANFQPPVVFQIQQEQVHVPNMFYKVEPCDVSADMTQTAMFNEITILEEDEQYK